MQQLLDAWWWRSNERPATVHNLHTPHLHILLPSEHSHSSHFHTHHSVITPTTHSEHIPLLTVSTSHSSQFYTLTPTKDHSQWAHPHTTPSFTTCTDHSESSTTHSAWAHLTPHSEHCEFQCGMQYQRLHMLNVEEGLCVCIIICDIIVCAHSYIYSVHELCVTLHCFFIRLLQGLWQKVRPSCMLQKYTFHSMLKHCTILRACPLINGPELSIYI